MIRSTGNQTLNRDEEKNVSESSSALVCSIELLEDPALRTEYHRLFHGRFSKGNVFFTMLLWIFVKEKPEQVSMICFLLPVFLDEAFDDGLSHFYTRWRLPRVEFGFPPQPLDQIVDFSSA